MTQLDRSHIENTFAAYAARYNSDDPKIALKIEHTYKVAQMSEEIARSISVPEAAAQSNAPEGAAQANAPEGAAPAGVPVPDLAWVCGMMHDIGRFEQVTRYGTFSDADSVDHAGLGADLLFREGLIGDYFPEAGAETDDSVGAGTENGVTAWLTSDRRALLELAVRSHSLYRLPEGLTQEETMYCNILRDADKVDIFRVNTETPLEDIYNVSTAELKASGLSEEVKRCFLEKHTVLRAYKKLPADFVVGHICLAFELIYPKSRELAKEQGYINKLLAFESDDPDTRRFFEYMRAHIWA